MQSGLVDDGVYSRGERAGRPAPRQAAQTARACQVIRGAPIATSLPDVVCVNLNTFYMTDSSVISSRHKLDISLNYTYCTTTTGRYLLLNFIMSGYLPAD